MWEMIWQTLKPNGVCAIFGTEPFSSYLRVSQVKFFKYDWIWRKPKGTGHLNAKKQPMRDIELISCFYKKQCDYNPQYKSGKPYSKDKVGKINTSDVYNHYTSHREDSDGKRYPKQLIEFGVVERGTVHPTQKPVSLLEYFIKTYTTSDATTVLDFAMGSGSTGIACLNLNRRFIGIEQDEKYFDIASDRLNKTLQFS
jgi:site-specific DNA-methyltransferase (adenine-specific)